MRKPWLEPFDFVSRIHFNRDGTWDLDLESVPAEQHSSLVRVLREAADMLEKPGGAVEIQ